MHYVILGTSNTPPIAWTKIIQSMVFIEYPHEGIVFLLGLNFLFFGVKKGFLVWVQDYNRIFDNFIKHTYKNMQKGISSYQHKML